MASCLLQLPQSQRSLQRHRPLPHRHHNHLSLKMRQTNRISPNPNLNLTPNPKHRLHPRPVRRFIHQHKCQLARHLLNLTMLRRRSPSLCLDQLPRLEAWSLFFLPLQPHRSRQDPQSRRRPPCRSKPRTSPAGPVHLSRSRQSTAPRQPRLPAHRGSQLRGPILSFSCWQKRLARILCSEIL